MAAPFGIIEGDCEEILRRLPAECVQCVVTSPPYWGLRDYGIKGQLGLEPTPDEYVEKIVAVFRQVRRVLRKDGTVFLNMGDLYASGGRGSGGAKQQTNKGSLLGPKKAPLGLKSKDLCMMPARVALALQADGWWLRSDIIWHKPNPMPESVTDRPTSSHEHVFLLTKAAKYYYDAHAVREKGTHRPDRNDRVPAGRNLRNVWTIPTEPFPEAHFATFPTKLVRPCILAGTSAKGACPGCGAAWVRVVDRQSLGIRGSSPAVPREARGRFAEQQGSSHSDREGLTQSISKSIGWKPGCDCNAGEPVPCLVLDPFCGSGTTGVVARRLGRRFVGIDLKPKFCEMSRERIEREGDPG